MAKIKLADIDTRATKDLDKQATKEKNIKIVDELNDLQNLLYAEAKHAVLVIIQGMDASGKDGIMKHVLSGLTPQGIYVKAFKAPTTEELSHDDLPEATWILPTAALVPPLNRSHYEDVLIT